MHHVFHFYFRFKIQDLYQWIIQQQVWNGIELLLARENIFVIESSKNHLNENVQRLQHLLWEFWQWQAAKEQTQQVPI